MRKRKPARLPTAVRREDLQALDRRVLADLVFDLVSGLPYHQQKKWLQAHLGVKSRSESGKTAARDLLAEVQAFCEESRAGAFVSWEREQWRDEGMEYVDDERHEEWAALFSDLAERAIELARSAPGAEVAAALASLFNLLDEAGKTTDMLGDCGAPADLLQVDLANMIETLARSVLAKTGGDSERTIAEVWPVAREYAYAGGVAGLARALDVKGRARLKTRLARAARARGKNGDVELRAEAQGLIELAELEKNPAEVLALKEEFASKNAIYLRDVLDHHRRRRNWAAVARFAELGVERFGHADEFARALIQARHALGDARGAQRAHVALFKAHEDPREFAALKRRSDALANWAAVFQDLLAAASKSEGPWGRREGRLRLLVAEGQEREAIAEVSRLHERVDFEMLKLVAKYGVARATDGADLTGCKKLRQLANRLRHEKDEPYEWLRVFLQNPATLDRADYVKLASGAYRRLIDLHLNSGVSARAHPAAHYGAIVFELSRHLDQPQLWQDLLGHLKQKHGRKRLIWERLRAEGCPI